MKLTTWQIRERAVELLESSSEGMRFTDLVNQIASEGQETQRSTIQTQVNQAMREAGVRIGRGLYRSRKAVGQPISTPTVRNPVPGLTKIGFHKAGEWHMDSDRIRVSIHDLSSRSPVVYAFVVDNEVQYVNATNRSLGQHMRAYSTPGPNNRPNMKINDTIRRTLALGKAVQIYALVEMDECSHCGIPINVAAGLVDPLREKFKPAWNLAA